MKRRSSVILWIVAAGTMLPGAPVLRAEPPPRPSPHLAELLHGLSSDSWEERTGASEALTSDPTLSIEEVERALMDNALEAEARERLSMVGERIFASTPRAALGVQFDFTQVAEGIGIANAVDGFDSKRVIRPGDVLRAIDGVPIEYQGDARVLIVSYNPGEEAVVELLRAGELIEVAVKMGSFDSLDTRSRQSPDPDILDASWRARLERLARRLGRTQTGVLAPDVPAERWNEWALRTQNNSIVTVSKNVTGTRITKTRAAEGDEARALAGGASRLIRTNDGAVPFLLQRKPGDLDQAMRNIINQQTLMQERIRQTDAILRDRILTRSERANLLRQQDQNRVQLRSLATNLEELRARAQEDLDGEQGDSNEDQKKIPDVKRPHPPVVPDGGLRPK